MNKHFVTMLGWWRWLAAFAVVLYHVRFLLLAPYDDVAEKGVLLNLFYFGTSLGHEGFVLYMLVSGMLLGGLSLRRWKLQGAGAWRDIAHKALWFYAFLVPGLLLGGLLDLTGHCELRSTGTYAYFDQFTPDFSLRAVAENLLPVQRFIVPGLGSNSMLYLLAYECWAYLAFAAFILPTRRRTGAVLGSFVAVVGSVLAPEFVGYLLLWMMGAAVYHYRLRLQERLSRGRALVLFVASLLTSRVVGAHLSEVPEQYVLVVRSLLDLQFGIGLTCLLLALGSSRIYRDRRSVLLWRLTRGFPAANSVIFACHFPLMMFAVAAASRIWGVPIAGQPQPLLFALFALVVALIYAYAWALSRLARRLVRLLGAARGMPVAPVTA
ncbi:hypothetical protein NX774_00080 [Massilia agilis]|uniref:Peptidoglycan/LPS O-acetylase OafA/YrhL n=1 Tax=Massilia agilis TaxID=1811226 RepID=A0ABT2D4U4_9BURK|nr:hypothetical protein [Massilia agilis]MCS0806322.1 hypothetical protein [Massilia agilis]